MGVKPPTREHNTLSLANGDILVNFLQIILTLQSGLATTHPLDVVHTIYLLVLRVRTIVTSSNRQKYYVLLKGVLQGQCHRDTTPIASQVGRHPMNCLKRQNIVKTYAVLSIFHATTTGNPAIIVQFRRTELDKWKDGFWKKG